MNISTQIAKHVRGVYFGGNWSDSNLKNCLQDVNWQQATTQVYNFNTIATLVFHTSYFITAVLQVLKGEQLNASDKLSFTHPPINSEADWTLFLNQVWKDAEEFASLVEKLPEATFWEIFSDEKYGNYYRNIIGIIEHTHYHLGQIAIIKNLIHQKK